MFGVSWDASTSGFLNIFLIILNNFLEIHVGRNGEIRDNIEIILICYQEKTLGHKT